MRNFGAEINSAKTIWRRIYPCSEKALCIVEEHGDNFIDIPRVQLICSNEARNEIDRLYFWYFEKVKLHLCHYTFGAFFLMER